MGRVRPRSDRQSPLSSSPPKRGRRARPISRQDLKALFEALDTVAPFQCDGTLRATKAFLRVRGLDVERVETWLQKYGGYCDCEVLLNVEAAFPDTRSG